MARLNPNYGSELHLLRMLGRHREYLNRKVCEATGAEHVGWLDFPSGEKRADKQRNTLWDREWQQLQFLPPADPARRAWQETWPAHRTGHNWDAIGRLRFGSTHEWLLVEAKANVEELLSTCQATDVASRTKIERALDATRAALGGPADRDWTKPYYQFCNRLVALHVLNSAGAPARLLYIYFQGDVGDQSRTCPASMNLWHDALAKQDQHIGLPVGLPVHHALQGRIHKLFLDVHCLE